jgi:hypothetical protein
VNRECNLWMTILWLLVGFVYMTKAPMVSVVSFLFAFDAFARFATGRV